MAYAEEREIFLLISSRALRFNGSYFLGHFAFNAGDGGFLR